MITQRRAFHAFFSVVLPFATAAASLAPHTAFAQAPTSGSEARVAVEARFQRYLIGARGHVDGILLADGSVVRMSPRAFKTDAPALQPGEALHIEAVKHPAATGAVYNHALVQRGSTVIADGRSLAKRSHKSGKHGEHGERKNRTRLAEVKVTSTVATLVSNARGKVDRLVLADGTVVAARHDHLDKLAIKVGDRVEVTGPGGSYDKGKALRLGSITLANGQVHTFPGRHAKQAATTT